ncbi:MAG: LptF/LptG family permease [Trueperaceae bacterium]
MTRWGRYLVAGTLPLFLTGVVALVLLLLLYFFLGVLADVLARGVSVSLLARYLLFKLPAAASPGLPLALLFAALLNMTRLGQDGEVKAALLLGVAPRRFVMPLVGLGLVVSALALFNDELVVPWSEGRAAEVEKDIMLRSPETVVQTGAFFTDALGRSIFIGQALPGGEFRDVTVITPGGSSGPREVITAERGEVDADAGVWRLEGITMRVLRDGRLALDVRSDSAVLPVRGLAATTSTPPDLVYLPLGQLLERLRTGDATDKAPEWTALHRKLAEPLAATAFALFAAAVGLFTFRRGSNLGFVAVLFLTFVYYATWSVAKLLGAQGTVPAWAAGWAPVALYMLASGVLLAAVRRR